MSEPAPRTALPYALGIATVLVLLAVSFDPAGRCFGFDAWAALPVIARLALTVAALGAGALAVRLSGPRGSAAPGSVAAGPRNLWPDVAIVLGFALACTLLRTQAHYLGDGWQSLSLLGADPPQVKGTAPIPAWLLPRLKGLFGPDPEAAALAAYRTLSIASGVVAAVAVVAGARPLVAERLPRALFAIGILFGGASIVFFGYVENYAPLVAATTAFAVLGAAAASGSPGYRIPAVAATVLAILSHVFGVALLPALAYLLLRRTRLGRPALALGVLAALVAVCAFVVLRDLALRLHFVPWVAGRFTLDGYTLLSAAHVTDLVNLLFVLAPAGLMLGAVALVARDAGMSRVPAIRFLVILAASGFAVAALVDPKLGMARDQDLFAFAGPPLLTLLLLAWVRVSRRNAGLRPFGAVAVALSAIVLFPRVWTLRDDERAIEPFRRALVVDHTKSRNAHHLLVERWRRAGREDLAEEEAVRWAMAYPERRAVLQARAAEDAGDYEAAAQLNLEAIAINPQYMDAYNNLGAVFILAGMDDAAVEPLEIAYALSPDEPGVLANLGAVLFRTGDIDRAEGLFLRLNEIRPTGYGPRRNLARIAQSRGDTEAYRRWIAASAAEPDATAKVLVEYGDLLLRAGRRAEAVTFLRRAIEAGVEEETARALLEALPELRDARWTGQPGPG